MLRKAVISLALLLAGVVCSGFSAWFFPDEGTSIWGFTLLGAFPGLVVFASMIKLPLWRVLFSALAFSLALGAFGFLFDSYVFQSGRWADQLPFFVIGAAIGAQCGLLIPRIFGGGNG